MLPAGPEATRRLHRPGEQEVAKELLLISFSLQGLEIVASSGESIFNIKTKEGDREREIEMKLDFCQTTKNEKRK